MNNGGGHRRRVSPSRRDFLKLAALGATASYFPRVLGQGRGHRALSGSHPNVIVMVFDAWSARNVSFYGYRRNTMPNLERLAGNATVYHNHYSAAMCTPPGTASLLTSLLPWTHRALQLGSSITRRHRDHQAFAAFHDTHNTVAYAQNQFADVFVEDAGSNVDTHVDSARFTITNRLLSGLPLLRKDRAVAYQSLDAGILQTLQGDDSSILLGPLNRMLRLGQRVDADRRFKDEYPFGVPSAGQGLFRLEDLVNGAIDILSKATEPSFTYLHLFPPHGTYRPTAPFATSFDDSWAPLSKQVHPLTKKPRSEAEVAVFRCLYDEYLASWDHEVARLFELMSTAGLFERSIVVLTADHGDMFERGEAGHETPLMYDPLIHIPLIVWCPGQANRQDIYAPTSSVDVLPTVAHLAGIPVPSWTEGQLLPGLGGQQDPGRSLFSMDAQQNAAWEPIRRISVSLTKNGQRLACYNYPGEWQGFEFYDLNEDPEELQDLYSGQPAAAMQMKDELLQRLSEANAPFHAGND